MYEKEVSINLSTSYLTRLFVGKIDKIIFKEIDGVDYVVVVDYKTGTQSSSLDNIEDGFNLQLPVYAYFLVKTHLFKNPKILGIYLQHILNNVKETAKKDLQTVQQEALKLDGYTTNDLSEISLIDPTYSLGKFIKGVSVLKTGGLGKNSKVLASEDFIKLVEIAEKVLINAFEEIEEANFQINPKHIGNDNKSCKYCPYINLCYRKNKDLNYLEVKKFATEIEGEQ